MKREHRETGQDRWETRLSDYLDDGLPGDERLQLEDHLRACASCTRVLAELRAVVLQAGEFAKESEPAGDLWAGIRPRLQPRRPKAPWRRAFDVLSPSPARTAWWRVPAFAAVAVLLVGVVASVLWLQRPGAGPSTALGTGPSTSLGTGTPGSHEPLEASREYYDTVAELRRVVEERLTHDPRVVEVLDINLAAIDAAIAGYRDALVTDPGDRALARRLAQARERKVEVLRQTVALAVEAAN